MAPKKKEVQKLSLGEFLNDSLGGGGGSWADEVEDTYGTQSFPSTDSRRPTGGYNSYGGGDRSTNDRGYSTLHDNLPQTLPDKPPYTAHIGNLSWDATEETITDFFDGCNVKNVRIILDRETKRPKGFAYAEFNDLEGLKTALTRDGEQFEGRRIRLTIAEPPRGGGGFGDRGGGGFGDRELDWGAKRGPLADIPGRESNRRDFSDRKPREFQGGDDKPARDITWERRGPLSPIVQAERPGSREGSRPRTNEGRTESFRSDRKASPAAWGPSEGRQDSRPPRREFSERPERPERVPTAAEKDFNWRNNMRAEPVAKAPASREGSEAPTSPAPAAALPVGRPKLNLTKRTVSEAPETATAAASSKASPFGAARPIDTAAREREIEEKKLKAQKEAEEKAEKAKEEKIAQEAAAKEAAEKAAEAAAEAAAKAKSDAEAAAAAEPKEEAVAPTTEEEKVPAKAREPREPRAPREPREAAPTSRAVESGNWRRGPAEPSRGNAGGPRRGGAPRGPRNDSGRGPRPNGSGPAPTSAPQSPSVEKTPASPAVDEDGWTTVTQPVKGRRGQGNRPVVS
ncbi:hypothetical protein QBC35DRAFT_513957 [Podospora australis]|uniref:RRM domain-containing protein n=1 Tax=Podospora australis TaxID=1536484 RepID=A0AAN7AK17_9PEZI|nr:hypothetical protein QBC35DRAFT_513957 [Podospora australis]